MTNDQGYVPFVIISIPPIRNSWLLTRITQRVPKLEQELLTLPEHLISSPCFSGVRVAQSICFFCVVFCWPLFILLCLFCWPLHYLPFIDLCPQNIAQVTMDIFPFTYIFFLNPMNDKTHWTWIYEWHDGCIQIINSTCLPFASTSVQFIFGFMAGRPSF